MTFLSVQFGHVSGDVQWSTVQWLLTAVAVTFAAALVARHLQVKHGSLPSRVLQRALAVLVALGVGTIIFPASGLAQSAAEPTGLPDLISDAPFIWFTKYVTSPDGVTQRVMAFDGYIHNIGTGRLDLTGNPQLPNGIKQRVFNGTEWEDVGSPTVKFETDDGHNHFHLMRAIEYQLWDEGQTSIVSDAQKVGFCLIDTEQMEEGLEAIYHIEASNYCGVDSPDATELTMGITPGWRDTYGASVSFQWVDVSNVEPGRYWVGALTDPHDEIVESNEDNNSLIFSINKYSIEGYVARDIEIQSQDKWN